MKTISFYLLFSLFLTTVSAQQNDAVGSLAIQLEKKITPSFSASFYNQYAFNENYSEVGYALFDLGLNYRLNSNFTVGINYRILSLKNLENNYDQRQFLYGDVAWSKNKGDFTLNIRSRYLTKYYGTHFAENENFRVNKHYLRNKVLLKYELNYTYSVFVSTEQIYRLDHLYKTEQWRYAGGLNYRINTRNRLQLSYSISQQVNKKAPDRNYTTGLTYYYKF
ncbi:MAG: DUF2490 domain-containing protein [Chitinophagales bacterium]|nr:DUF2490 domain-containing protein [Chitinophagales bacterium]